ncbi:MAG: peptidoglycan editing factor PgeF [Thiomargarita sp.]|nr:peptidoglycan editing factor PgeF [Thiomargarita sp.]
MLKFIKPNWSAPSQVKAITTTRYGGYSNSPYNSLNLAEHVNDNPSTVIANRLLLKQSLALANEPTWLKQVHSTELVTANFSNYNCVADGAFSTQIGEVCAILTADCLPVLICDQAANCVAAVHAGWRGLANGILENTLHCLKQPAEKILVWLGPAIGAQVFEVGEEVRDAFVNFLPQAEQAFKISRDGHWFADLYLLARQRLNAQGVTNIYGGNFCTYTDSQFYSYRRDNITGRMASLIWLT